MESLTASKWGRKENLWYKRQNDRELKSWKKREINNYWITRGDLERYHKWNNIRIIEIPEKEEQGGAEGILEQIIAENIPNLGKETGIQLQEAENPSQNQ